MSNIKTFLKALHKSGYPNPTPDVPTIAKMVSYPIDNFLFDLIDNVGMEGAEDFVEKSFSSLGLMGEGLKIDLSDYLGNNGSYIYLMIYSFDLVLNEPEEPVWIHYSWGDNELVDGDESKTLEDIYDNTDMGEMGEFEDLMYEIEGVCRKTIYKKTGFVIHFDSQI